jgi:hypothetical protein
MVLAVVLVSGCHRRWAWVSVEAPGVTGVDASHLGPATVYFI